MTIYLGSDVSKGYADFCFTGPDGDLLHQCRLDDTAEGHEQLEDLVEEMVEIDDEDEVSIEVAVEATGGLERNWLRRLKLLGEQLDLTVYQVNPFVLRRFTDAQLHANKTDPLSAQALATYLRHGMGPEHALSGNGPDTGLRTLERKTLKKTDQIAELKTELKNLLQVAHPELVQYARSAEIPQWLLSLLSQYPTADQVAEASVEELAEIPYLSTERAEQIIEAASTSVASRTDSDTALPLEMTVEDLMRLSQQVDRLKERLWDKVASEEGPQILRSIRGIGEWSATVLYCEIGSLHRFPSATQLVAYAGLDSQREYSGDLELDRPISKRGNARIRRILYNCVQVALQENVNPPIRNFYDRLRDRGKHHMTAMTACMRKLLSIIFGCWSKGERFDPGYEARIKQRQTDKQDEESSSSTKEESAPTQDLSAPVSATEARKRKEATMPQESGDSRMRGQAAASS